MISRFRWTEIGGAVGEWRTFRRATAGRTRRALCTWACAAGGVLAAVGSLWIEAIVLLGATVLRLIVTRMVRSGPGDVAAASAQRS
jgi:hypothetical protein